MAKICLVTGASAGIGRATALLFAEKGYDVIITGRRGERLKALKEEIEKKTNANVLDLCFDVRKKADVDKAIDSLNKDWKNIDVLINNAGLASGLGPIQEGDVEDWEKMIDTNIKGLLYVSRAVMPMMVKRNSGHIFNVGSIAGKYTYANGNVYCATKHAVDSLTKAMRIDLLPHKIKVTGICPGAVETEFSIVRFHGDTKRAAQTYEGWNSLKAEDVADVIYYAASLPAHVCLNDIVITPTAQANPNHLFKG